MKQKKMMIANLTYDKKSAVFHQLHLLVMYDLNIDTKLFYFTVYKLNKLS